MRLLDEGRFGAVDIWEALDREGLSEGGARGGGIGCATEGSIFNFEASGALPLARIFGAAEGEDAAVAGLSFPARAPASGSRLEICIGGVSLDASASRLDSPISSLPLSSLRCPPELPFVCSIFPSCAAAGFADARMPSPR